MGEGDNERTTLNLPWKKLPRHKIPRPFPKPPVMRNLDEDGNCTEELYVYQKGDDLMLCLTTTRTLSSRDWGCGYVTSLKDIFKSGLDVVVGDLHDPTALADCFADR